MASTVKTRSPRKPTARSRNFRKSNVSSEYVTKFQADGGRLMNSSNPPLITQMPWYNLTVAYVDSSKDVEIHVEDVVAKLINQMGKQNFPDSAKIEIKIRSVQIWNLDGKGLGLQPFDYTDHYDAYETNQPNLGGWYDSGNATTGQMPYIGYQWPKHCTDKPHLVTMPVGTDVQGKRKVCAYACQSNTKMMIHFKVLWKFISQRGSGVNTNFPTMSDLIKSVDGVQDMTRQVYDQMPSKTLGAAHIVMIPIPALEKLEGLAGVGKFH